MRAIFNPNVLGDVFLVQYQSDQFQTLHDYSIYCTRSYQFQWCCLATELAEHDAHTMREIEMDRQTETDSCASYPSQHIAASGAVWTGSWPDCDAPPALTEPLPATDTAPDLKEHRLHCTHDGPLKTNPNSQQYTHLSIYTALHSSWSKVFWNKFFKIYSEQDQNSQVKSPKIVQTQIHTSTNIKHKLSKS